MKYAIRFNGDFRYMSEVDEIILDNYSGSDSILTRIPEITKENKNQKIVLDLQFSIKPIEETIIYINKLRQDGYNISTRINYGDKETREKLKDAGIPFFFDHFCINMEMAYTQAKMGASEIYVTEELGFRMKDLQHIRKDLNVQLRVMPNICQSQDNNLYHPMECFWIRPEDTELYEPYIDTFEIIDWGADDRHPGSRLSVLYEIYRNRQWLGNLNNIILDFISPIVNNRGVNPHFGEVRLNCGKRCLQGKCYLCRQTADFADTLLDNGIQLIKPKYKKELTEEQVKIVKEILNEQPESN